MNIQTWKISAVKPYEKNPRRNDGAVDAVAASLREFGFQQPLVVDKAGILISSACPVHRTRGTLQLRKHHVCGRI